MARLGADGETTAWLLAHTKPCPRCGVGIQKDRGCNHMTCTAAGCAAEFCWICGGPWAAHLRRSCNAYFLRPAPVPQPPLPVVAAVPAVALPPPLGAAPMLPLLPLPVTDVVVAPPAPGPGLRHVAPPPPDAMTEAAARLAHHLVRYRGHAAGGAGLAQRAARVPPPASEALRALAEARRVLAWSYVALYLWDRGRGGEEGEGEEGRRLGMWMLVDNQGTLEVATEGLSDVVEGGGRRDGDVPTRTEQVRARTRLVLATCDEWLGR